MDSLTPAELRTLFLFESLEDEQLAWLAARGRRHTYDSGTPVYREGEPETELFILLAGGMRMTRRFGEEELVLVETDQRGSYAGAVRAYVAEQDAAYANSVVTTAPSSFFVLPAADFGAFMHTWFPLAVHLLDGLFLGVRNSEATIRQREQLARLGTLSANLAHELNNPAGAAVRATAQLRDRLAAVRARPVAPAPETMTRLLGCRPAAGAPPRTALEEADLEQALTGRLTGLGVVSAYDLAPVFAAAGLGPDWLDRVVTDLAGDPLESALSWLADSLETGSLLDEIAEATGRISTLVAAVKQYSYLDTASVQDIDVHVGLDSTVTMLGHKLQGVQVVREYDRELPRVPAHPAELNQVWTNLIANAADAMGGSGRLLLRTSRDGADLVVEVDDNGTGILEAVRPRVFDTFFTTKGVGQGSGLGLDNARRIVERRHHGRLSFTTGPAGTVFAVRLPISQQLG